MSPKNRDELVELVALAGHCAKSEKCERPCVACALETETELAALSASGLAVVPKECTEEMNAAFISPNIVVIPGWHKEITAAIKGGNLLERT